MSKLASSTDGAEDQRVRADEQPAQKQTLGPLYLDVSDALHQLSDIDIFMSCVDIQDRIVPSLEEKASACTMAPTHLYYARVLQAYPNRGDFIGRRGGDINVFLEIAQGGAHTADRTVLDTTINLCVPNSRPCAPYLPEAFPNTVPEQLSHLLPYHVVTGRVNTDIEDLTITVISKLLSSPSSPSTQIIANCTLLACVMGGVQVDKKDIARIDKSSALPRLGESLLAQFQKALWAWDGGELDEDSTGVVRQAWNLLDVICRVLELAGYYNPSCYTMRNLDSLQSGSCTPEDTDWLVDYLDYICSDDHEVAYDILLLLGSMGSLIACMDSNMPPPLRHAALRATHSAREEIASIDAIDDARLWDMVSTKLSPAILLVLYYFFDYDRDLCYLELVPDLARNSDWHPHLSGDRHVDRCISMISEYCDRESPTGHALYIAGILLRIAAEQTLVTSLESVTEQQWWDVMRCAWYYVPYAIRRTRDFELLALVDGTKKYMQVTSKSGLKNLIRDVDHVLNMGLEMGPEMQGLEQAEGTTIAVMEWRTTASSMLEGFD
ncbi:uncharacterized protein HD556DRAFT_1536490 [Suillus plorans]|uniref:Uncharacterized protein n=1 Tax=Suillus plorans TaxID=116603 RepID=A0A9P7APG4_9AGAM|nr:uncharacterized protein HD556DRAFT_1536490 [Suillus plorans]KAG1793461.1 hypothetical protein HD556DRAFT_1536490 [Suillus plorans]